MFPGKLILDPELPFLSIFNLLVVLSMVGGREQGIINEN